MKLNRAPALWAALGLALAVSLSVPLAQAELPARMENRLEHWHQALQLTSTQEAQYQRALEKMRNTGPQLRANHDALREKMEAEMQKPVPDLQALATLKDSTEQANQTLRRAVRAEWLTLYGMLTPSQVSLVKEQLKKMHQHHHGLGGDHQGGHPGGHGMLPLF